MGTKSREDAVQEIMESGATVESDEKLTQMVDDIVNSSENGTPKVVRAFRTNPTATAREILEDVCDASGMSRDDVIDLALRVMLFAPREIAEKAYNDLQTEKSTSVLSLWK